MFKKMKRYNFIVCKSESDPDISLDTRRRNSIHSVPFYVGLSILLLLLLLYGIVFLVDNNLPTPLYIEHEKDHPDSFITERAVLDLKELTSHGPRVTGSYENEVLAVDFLIRTINATIQEAHANHKIELDLQIVSGGYSLRYTKVEQISVYSNVQNVVVKLYGSNSNYSVLVNSHFDSVPTSPGASDDGINVAVMLEILRKLTKTADRPLHNIVFLFNGAEETPLQASHGFITQHKWARECKVIVNLEAAGVGSKMILFQSGPETPWLMKYYNKVPHPYGQAAGEEIFQSGLIPSDTDFRIFRDYGDLVGVDMAFFKNGYRYHTKYDDFDHIPWGSYQHAGDNALSLIRSFSNALELSEPVPSPGKTVYFDILGLFMVSYTTLTAAIVNVLAVIASVAVFVFSCWDFRLNPSKFTFKYLGFTLGAVLGSWIIAGLSVFILAWLLDALGSTMSWYGNPWIIFGLYVVPSCALSGCLLFFINHKNLSLNIRCQMQAHTVRLIWTIILLIGTIAEIRSVYALLLPVLLNSLAFVVIHGLRWQHTIRKWQLVYLLSLIIPSMILMYQTLITFSMFVPLTGRMGSHRNPDVIIGMLTVIFTILITSPYVALVTLLRDAKYYFIYLAVIFVTFFIIVFTPLGFPYTGDFDSPAAQRQWLTHTSRVFHDKNGKIERTDSGIFLLNLDRNSPDILKKYVKDIAKAKPIKEDCEKYLLCALPLSHGRMVEVMDYSTWIPASQPVIPDKVKFILNSKEQINSTIIRYNITVSGPDRLGIFLKPKANKKLIQTSLLKESSQPNFFLDDDPLFFILFTSGIYPSNLSFTFDIESSNLNGSLVDIAVVGKYIHNNKFVKTPYYSSFLQQIPDWADVTAWLGSYSSYIL